MEKLENLRCSNCGGQLQQIAAKQYQCIYCKDILELKEDLTNEEVINLNRAAYFRERFFFDDALDLYEKALKDNPNNEVANWGAFLSQFGIEYVEDYNGTFKPTCHRASNRSVLESEFLKRLPENYQKQASEIEEVRKEIISDMKDIPEYDVFICYKKEGSDGRPTAESKWARDVYEKLTYERKLKVFFAEKTLTGSSAKWEAHIYSALRSSKLMLVMTSSREYLNAQWVKNEWKRFIEFAKEDKMKVLRVLYRGMDVATEFPAELKQRQFIDLNEYNWMESVLSAVDDAFVDKVEEERKRKEAENAAKEEEQRKRDLELENKLKEQEERLQKSLKANTIVATSAGNGPGAANLLRRARRYFDDCDWDNADEYCEKILDMDAENAEAWWLKLLCQEEVESEDELIRKAKDFTDNSFYLKAIKFANEEQKQRYESVVNKAKYYGLIAEAELADVDRLFEIAKELRAVNYLDSAERAKGCEELARAKIVQRAREREQREQREQREKHARNRRIMASLYLLFTTLSMCLVYKLELWIVLCVGLAEIILFCILFHSRSYGEAYSRKFIALITVIGLVVLFILNMTAENFLLDTEHYEGDGKFIKELGFFISIEMGILMLLGVLCGKKGMATVISPLAILTGNIGYFVLVNLFVKYTGLNITPAEYDFGDIIEGLVVALFGFIVSLIMWLIVRKVDNAENKRELIGKIFLYIFVVPLLALGVIYGLAWLLTVILY